MGLAVFAAMPTSLSSCVTLSVTAGANSAIALLLVVLSNTIGILVLPFLLASLLATTSAIPIAPGPLLQTLVQTILLPLVVGSLLRVSSARLQRTVDTNRVAVSLCSTLLLCLVPWMQISTTALARPNVPLVALVTTTALSLAIHLLWMLMATVGCAWLAVGGADAFEARHVRRPVVLCCGQKTLPVAITAVGAVAEAVGILPGVAVVPCVFAHFGQIITDSFVVSGWVQSDQKRLLLL